MKIMEVKPILCDQFYTFCKVTIDEGIVGWGDGTEWATPKGVESAIKDFGNFLIGEDPRNIERLWQLAWRSAYTGGKDLSCALAAISSALIDVVGKIYDIPAIELIGGKVWNKVRLYTHCDRPTVEETLQFAEELKHEGWTACKCHPVGLPSRYKDPEWANGSLDWPEISRTASLRAVKQTAKHVEALRETVGEDIELGIDVNNRLDVPSSIRLAKALEPLNLLFMEDPICHHENSVSSYRRLTESTSTPIACGENIYTIWDFRSYLESRAIDLLLPDVCHTGVLQAKKIAALGEAYHVPICPHNPNSVLSAIISANLVASVPNFVALEFIRGFALPDKDTTVKPWVDKIMRPSLSRLVKDGYLELPEGPGWGVDIDEKELAKHPYIEPCQWLEKRKKSFRNDFNLSRPSK
jgi:galactonate dehydratase